jgi:hypothetical protein
VAAFIITTNSGAMQVDKRIGMLRIEFKDF